jgi:predicted transposase YbfD/YdcC
VVVAKEEEWDMTSASLSFFWHFGNLRVANWTGRSPYRVLDLVFIGLCATIANAQTWAQIEAFARQRRDWLTRFCQLPRDDHGEPITPSHDSLERLFKRLDPHAFGRCFGSWTATLAQALGLQQVAIDGKTLRGSADQANGLRALHLVSAWSTANHLSLAQVATDDKSNEITAIPELLRLLELKGALVSMDAMGCQKAIASQIVAQGADYVLPVKGNQPRLQADIAATVSDVINRDFEGVEHDIYHIEESGHGRLERRNYMVVYDLHLIRDRALWANLAAVGVCFYERESAGKLSSEDHYFIGSRRASAKDFAQALRGHWGIENNLHWLLDVAFAEDDNQVANRNAAQNLAVLRRLALTLLKRCPVKGSLNTKRYNASLSSEFLEQVLRG